MGVAKTENKLPYINVTLNPIGVRSILLCSRSPSTQSKAKGFALSSREALHELLGKVAYRLSTRCKSSAEKTSWDRPEVKLPCAPACSWANLKGSVTGLEVRSIQDLVNDARIAQQVLS